MVVKTFPGNVYMEAQHSHCNAVSTKPAWALRGFLVMVKGEVMEKCSSVNAIRAMLLLLSPKEDALVMVHH